MYGRSDVIAARRNARWDILNSRQAVDDEPSLKDGDEVAILTHSQNLPDLNKRWNSKQTGKVDREKSMGSKIL